jgi:hypothetical protein
MLEEFTDDNNQLTIHVFTGVVLPDDIFEAVKALYASNPTPHHLWDVTQADLTRINPKDLDKIALLAHKEAPSVRTGRTAIVASSDLGFGFGRMYESFARISGQSVEVHSFRSRKDAEDWIAEVTS